MQLISTHLQQNNETILRKSFFSHNFNICKPLKRMKHTFLFINVALFTGKLLYGTTSQTPKVQVVGQRSGETAHKVAS